jgi:hypothetical protein
MQGVTVDTVSIEFFSERKRAYFFVTYLACLCERCVAEKGNISYVSCLRERCVAAARSELNWAALTQIQTGPRRPAYLSVAFQDFYRLLVKI